MFKTKNSNVWRYITQHIPYKEITLRLMAYCSLCPLHILCILTTCRCSTSSIVSFNSSSFILCHSNVMDPSRTGLFRFRFFNGLVWTCWGRREEGKSSEHCGWKLCNNGNGHRPDLKHTLQLQCCEWLERQLEEWVCYSSKDLCFTADIHIPRMWVTITLSHEITR